ncbi:uncharacterized protein LOC118748063 isoform X2 [Rhagoletis pomonella]|uniref:uncharacterized protein LOC118748063 isoform X2 n=1 Tax=Rhagoletis pomonella TaxID=28610 RepID=UPI00177C1514|nr:uncharacterized protein LOC118748063 isoform X2 [Rhagoletis pomonella]
MLEEPSFSEAIDWEFAEEMAFLPNVSHKRKTFTSPALFGEESNTSPLCTAEESNVSQPNESCTQYDYDPAPPKRCRSSSTSQNPEVWNRFSTILKKQEGCWKTAGAQPTTHLTHKHYPLLTGC